MSVRASVNVCDADLLLLLSTSIIVIIIIIISPRGEISFGRSMVINPHSEAGTCFLEQNVGYSKPSSRQTLDTHVHASSLDNVAQSMSLLTPPHPKYQSSSPSPCVPFANIRLSYHFSSTASESTVPA